MGNNLSESLLYEIALTMLPQVGSVLAKNLLAYCGSAKAVFSMSKGKLTKIPAIGEERATAIVQSDVLKKAEAEVAFVQSYNIQPLFFTSELYPQRLKECTDSPLMLYYKGNADLNNTRMVAVVGTRKCTEYGKELTRHLVRDLAAHNVTVVSGLAYGIDVTAHQASVDYKVPTVGVLGHSLNMIYPEQHKTVAKRMVENGGLLTEFNTSDEFTPHNFPERNRIVAGMCDAVVVVESSIKGGAVLTAQLANGYNRDVFAYPGKTTDKNSAGCNYLIKTNRAMLIESATDLLQAMNWDGETTQPVKPLQLQFDMSDNERTIYKVLNEGGELEIDTLASLCKLSSGMLASTLLEMEMNGIVLSLPGKRYKLS